MKFGTVKCAFYIFFTLGRAILFAFFPVTGGPPDLNPGDETRPGNKGGDNLEPLIVRGKNSTYNEGHSFLRMFDHPWGTENIVRS